MKAKGITENLYFNQHTAQYNHERRNDDDIEYTRTDAFIEKACDWFRRIDDKEPPYTTTEEFIEGFKKAMKL